MFRAVLYSCVLIVCAHAHDDGKKGEQGQGTTAGSPPEPVTQTPGGAVRGSVMTTRQGRPFHAYRGVPYARPPVGDLRFQPPVPITRYAAEVDARNEGPGCPQPVATEGFVVDEDCLRVNVYTPGNNVSKPLPVVVYIHPGGFYSVSGRSDLAGPERLLERDLVLVTINYRLATLGFLSTGDKHAPGNYGFKDQVAALRWVQRNIRSFGGDPNLVTVAGYSAGSLSIGLLMVSPMGKGLFHHAISMSAMPISQVVIGTDQRYLAERQAKLVNCPTNSTKDMVACLKNKPWKELAASLDGMFEFGYDPVLLWNVVIEPDCGQERYLTEQPLETLKSGRALSVPYIISQTKDEFFWKAFNLLNNETQLNALNSNWEGIAPIAFMLPKENSDIASRRLRESYFHSDKPLVNDSETASALGKLYSDGIIGFSVHKSARLMAKYSKKKVYFYEFAYVGNSSHYVDPVTKKPVGAAHHDELIYLFKVSFFPEISLGSADNDIVEKLTAIWYNFARYGDPNPQPDTPELADLSWPAMTTTNHQYLRIDDGFSVHKNLFEERFKVWDELYPARTPHTTIQDCKE